MRNDRTNGRGARLPMSSILCRASMLVPVQGYRLRVLSNTALVAVTLNPIQCRAIYSKEVCGGETKSSKQKTRWPITSSQTVTARCRSYGPTCCRISVDLDTLVRILTERSRETETETALDLLVPNGFRRRAPYSQSLGMHGLSRKHLRSRVEYSIF